MPRLISYLLFLLHSWTKLIVKWSLTYKWKARQMRLCENEDCVIMSLLRNGEVDRMCQYYKKSVKGSANIMHPNIWIQIDTLVCCSSTKTTYYLNQHININKKQTCHLHNPLRVTSKTVVKSVRLKWLQIK